MASPQQKLYVKSGGGGRALCRSRISNVSVDSGSLRIPALHIVPSVCVLNQPLNSGANAVQKMEAF